MWTEMAAAVAILLRKELQLDNFPVVTQVK